MSMLCYATATPSRNASFRNSKLMTSRSPGDNTPVAPCPLMKTKQTQLLSMRFEALHHYVSPHSLFSSLDSHPHPSSLPSRMISLLWLLPHHVVSCFCIFTRAVLFICQHHSCLIMASSAKLPIALTPQQTH